MQKVFLILTDVVIRHFLCPSVLSVGLWQNNHLYQQSAHHKNTAEEARSAAAPHNVSRGLGGMPKGQGAGEQEED